MRTKKLVLVVHGIGEQKPGECLGLLTSSMPMTRLSGTNYDIDQLPETEWGPGDKRNPELFTCHSRTFEMEGPRGGEKIVFAEVYWADLLALGHRTINILASLLGVILGLAHIVRESVAETYRDHGLMRRLSNLIIYLLHGPIAGMNVMLLIAAVAASLTRAYLPEGEARLEDPFWVVCAAPLIIVPATLVFLKSQSYLWRSFAGWLMTSVFMLSLIGWVQAGFLDWDIPFTQERVCSEADGWAAALDCAVKAPVHALDDWIKPKFCQLERALADPEVAECQKALTGVVALGLIVLLVQQILWLTIFCLMTWFLCAHACHRFRSRGQPEYRRPALAPVALAAMPLFWLLLLCCIWAVGNLFDPKFAGHGAIFQEAFFIVWVNWAVAGLIAVATIAIMFGPYRQWKARVGPATYFAREAGPDSAPRLIVHEAIARLVMLCPVALLAVGGLSAVQKLAGGEYLWGLPQLVVEASYWVFPIVLKCSVVLGIAIYVFREQIRVGIDLFADIVNYFRIESYDPKAKRQSYLVRNQIERRFISVAREMIRRHAPDEVVIVSHSQGTVITLNVLTDKLYRDLLPRSGRWTLITMGSPFTHIYGRYFGADFDVPSREESGLSSWINIFRIDDFVGTHMHAEPAERRDNWPREVPVGTGGHTGYWSDWDVVREIRDAIFRPGIDS